MIRTIFTSTKGFHIPNPGKSSPHEALLQNTKLITNGFDQIQWDKSDDDLSSGNAEDSFSKENCDQDSEYTDEVDEHDLSSLTTSENTTKTSTGIYEDHSSKLSYVSETGYSLSTLSGEVSGGHQQPANEIQAGDTSNDNDSEIENGANHTSKGKKKGGKGKKMTKDEIKQARKLKKQYKLEKRQKKNHRERSNTKNKGTPINDTDFDQKVDLLEKLYKEVSNTDEDRVLKFYDITVYQEDLRNLRNDEWLNDNNIAFIYEYLTRFEIVPKLKQKTKFLSDEMIEESIVMLLPTFTFLLAHHPDPSELKGVLPKIENASFVFMPVNDNEDLEAAEGGSHWSLLLIAIKERKAIIYDSMVFANESESLGVIAKLEKYLGYKLQVMTEKSTPQQINGSDCGILVLANTCILLSRILNTPENTFLNLSMKNVFVSAIDARIFIMGTILNLVRDQTQKRE